MNRAIILKELHKEQRIKELIIDIAIELVEHSRHF